MIGIPLGLLAANAAEWCFHRYVQHGWGRDKKSFWSFHWHEHHRNASLNEFRDPCYERFPFGWHAQGKEILTLSGACLALTPLIPMAPFFVGTLYYSAFNYYRVHKKSHLDPAWAREHLPWHYDHHMGPNPHANWCVTKPWFDDWMGTRQPYAGTEKERQDRERFARKKQKQTRLQTAPGA